MLNLAIISWTLISSTICYAPVDISTLGKETEVPLFQVHGPIDPIKPNITILASGTFGGIIYPMGSFYDVGMKIAVEALANAGILSDFNLIVNFYDERCDHALGIRLTIELMNKAKSWKDNVIPMLVGPICAEIVYIQQYVKEYDFIYVADSSVITSMFYDRKRFGSAFAFWPSFETNYEGIAAFIEKHNWKTVYILSETFAYWEPYEKTLEDNLRIRNITMARIGKVLHVNGVIDLEFFKPPVDEMTLYGDDPRIIIVNTNYAASLACTLYDAGLYGPQYVYIWTGLTHPQPNAPYGPPNCSEEMIAAICRSVIIFNLGTPFNLQLNMTDAVGMSPKVFDEEMKSKSGQPNFHLNPLWFPWRTVGYTPVVGAALVIDQVHNALKARNDSILNWVTSSNNFNENSSYIHELFKSHLQNFKYNGLGTYGDVTISRSTGVTGFWQMQQEDPTQWSTESFEIVPVATYDADTKEFVNLRPMKWLTFDGKAPFDAIKEIETVLPLLPVSSRVALLTITIILIVLNIGSFIRSFKISSPAWSKRNENVLTIANILSLKFNILIVNLEDRHAGFVCMAASLCLVVGHSLLTLALLSKLNISFNVFTRLPTKHISKRESEPDFDNRTIKRLNNRALRKQKRILPYVSTILLSVLSIGVMWLALNPIQTERSERNRQQSDYHPDIFIVHHSYICTIEFNPNVQGFIFTLLCLHLIVLIGCLRIAILANKVPKSLVGDILRLRILTYAIATIEVAGGAVTWMMFSDDPNQLVTSVSILNIIIVTLTTIFELLNTFLMK